MARIESYPLHGGQLRQISERFGIPVSQLLDFSANINPDGPPSAVLSSLRESLNDLSTLTEYPDLQQTELKQSIARYAGVGEQNIVVANGFVPLLEAALRTLQIRRCLLPVPAFVEYRKTLDRAGIETSLYTLSDTCSFQYDPEAMAIGKHDAILLANPQNPSGVCHDASVIRDLIVRAAKRNIYVLLDEAFIDYVPQHSLTNTINEFSNLIVFRSVTKFYGMPGLRLAYATSNSALATAINENLPPWPITTLASLAGVAALEDRSYAERSRTENRIRRVVLQRKIEAFGLRVYPSAASYLLFRLPVGIAANTFWERMIIEHQIVLRSCANYENLPPGHFRVAVRAQRENVRLTTAIEESLSHYGSGCR